MITNLTEAMTAVVQAKKIMLQVVETCTVEQLSSIEGIRHWLETYSIDRVQCGKRQRKRDSGYFLHCCRWCGTIQA